MNPGFLASEVATGARRNVSMFISLIIVSMVSMFFVGSGLLSQRQVAQAKGDWYDKVHAFVYLCTDDDKNISSCSAGAATEAQNAAVRSTLESLKPIVTTITPKSSQDALNAFQEQFKDSPYASSVQANSMPNYFEVSLRDPKKYDDVAKAIDGMPGVAHVSNLHEVLAPFFSFLNMLSIGSAALATIMVICSVLLMMTTIRQVAFTRRRQIGIMRLVGAPNHTIYLPFILEVMIAALLGAAAAIGMLYAMVGLGLGNFAGGSGGFINLIDTSDVLPVVPWLLGISAVLSLLTSFVALRRYLKI